MSNNVEENKTGLQVGDSLNDKEFKKEFKNFALIKSKPTIYIKKYSLSVPEPLNMAKFFYNQLLKVVDIFDMMITLGENEIIVTFADKERYYICGKIRASFLRFSNEEKRYIEMDSFDMKNHPFSNYFISKVRGAKPNNFLDAPGLLYDRDFVLNLIDPIKQSLFDEYKLLRITTIFCGDVKNESFVPFFKEYCVDLFKPFFVNCFPELRQNLIFIFLSLGLKIHHVDKTDINPFVLKRL